MGILAAFAVPHPPLLIPGVGEDSQLRVQKTADAYKEIAARSAALQPETLVIISPHATLYSDYFHISPGSTAQGNFNSFSSNAAYSVEYDQEFITQLETVLAKRGISGGTRGEREPALDHGTMVPLHFFGEAAGDEGGAGKGVKIVRVGLSGLSRELHRECGEAVAQTAEMVGRKTVVIGSGDLSHKLLASGPYGFAPEGSEFDQQLCAALASGSVAAMMAIDEGLSVAAAECGLLSFIMMGGALDGLEYESELLSYEGPFGVGYAVAAYAVRAEHSCQEDSCQEHSSHQHSPQENPSQEHSAPVALASQEHTLPVALARQVLQSYFDANEKRPARDTPQIMALLKQFQKDSKNSAVYEELAHGQAGVFVSLYKNDELRGCIGTIAPTKDTILDEIIANAVSAAVEDPRFPPVGLSELECLSIKVDVLGAAEPVVDRTTLDAERYGVIVSFGRRRGLLLPALEGVDTPEEQIAIALSKARIGANEPYELERFEVVRYT